MRITKTSNFDKFICIADKCPCSCCKGWQIVIDDEKLSEYVQLSEPDKTSSLGTIAPRLYNGIDWDEGCFKQFDGRCAMLGDDEFCDLQREAGEEMLCQTCRQYPRHMEEFKDVREWSLSLSCPEVARIILSNTDRLEFIVSNTSDSDDEEDYEDFDYELYDNLLEVRSEMYDIIQDRNIGFTDKARALILLISDDNDDDSIDNECDIDYTDKRLFSKLFELETLNPSWADIVDTTWNNWEDELRLSPEEEIQAEQLLMFWIYTYFCGAVYDDWVLSKVMLAVCSTYWIFQIHHACKLEGGLIQAAYSYAREIEHSDINLDDLEEWFESQE